MNPSEKITWFILIGKKKDTSPPISWVDKTRQSMVLDLLEIIKKISSIDRIIISSNDKKFLQEVSLALPNLITDYIYDTPFSFPQWITSRVEKYKPQNLFYWGGGACPFITFEILEPLCTSVILGENILYTNNFFSADWVAFTPASAVLEITPPPMDNNLAYYLWRDRQIRSIYIDPVMEIVGDVDTPADLLVLSIHPKTGKRVKKHLKSLNLDTTRVKRFASLLKERNRIFLSGRVGSSLFRYLDRQSMCKFRILSEERGMRATGRLQRRQVKSILGKMLEGIGIEETFTFIEEICDGAVIDSRVPFAHIRGKVSKRDRFFSDLGMYKEIKDPWVRKFTKRVLLSPIPILTGGHSLILGGLWSLVSAFGEVPWFV